MKALEARGLQQISLSDKKTLRVKKKTERSYSMCAEEVFVSGALRVPILCRIGMKCCFVGSAIGG